MASKSLSEPVLATKSITQNMVTLYSVFRLILALSLFVSLGFSSKGLLPLANDTWLLAFMVLLTASTSTILLFKNKSQSLGAWLFLSLVFDIALIHGFSYLKGGFSSGTVILLIAPVAMAQIIFTGKHAIFFPALASVSVLTEIFAFSLLQQNSYQKYFIPGAWLCSIFFIEAIILGYLVRSLKKAENIAHKANKRSYQLENINSLIVERMQTGVIIFDQSLNVIQANNSAQELTGFSLLPNCSLTNTAFRQAALSWFENADNKKHKLNIASIQNELVVNFSAIDALDDSYQFIAFITNQSEVKRQAQLYKLSSLGRLSASIAHEIRNPLTAIQQAGQLLEQSEHIGTSEDQKLLAMIIKHCQRIDGIISNVSQIAKRDSGNPEKIHLETILDDVIDDLKVQFPNFTICKKLPNECSVLFDRGHLYQVLHNLIQNALSYSLQYQQAAKADVTVEAYASGLCQLYIQDDGPGVHKDFQQEIFEPFFSQRKGGSGLGLYLAREFCELNMATLEYTSLNNRHAFKISFSHPNKKMH